MDKLPSSAFRRYFAKLDAPTIVTVNGHPIGVWSPVNVVTQGPGYGTDAEKPWPLREFPARAKPARDAASSLVPEDLRERIIDRMVREGPTFNSRPFSPAPKK